MKLKMMMVAVAMMASSVFAENYLYWMVDVSEDDNAVEFSYATVKLDGTILNNQAGGYELGTKIGSDSYPEGDYTSPDVYAYGFSDSGSNFLFELWNGGSVIANKKVSYADLLAASHIGRGTMSQASLYTASGFTVVPEPTSGLLLLFGLAGLALRRKRA